jgi:hypothetical protein
LRLVAAGLAGALACSVGGPADSPTGSLEVEWIGSDTGKLSAPAVAEWCDSLKLLELRAIHGDTGIALVFYPSGSGTRADSVPRASLFAKRDSMAKPDSVARGDSATPGKYPVVAPERADSSRPAAAVALRWFAETSIRGFRGDSGTVVLESSGPAAGRFSAYLRSATEGSRLTVTGSFKDLSITPAPESCAGRPSRGPVEADELGEPDEPEETDRPVETAD